MEFFWILIKTVFEIFVAMFKAIITMLPGIFEMKKYLSYMTPKGLIALGLGVPVVVITVVAFLAKLIFKKIIKQR